MVLDDTECSGGTNTVNVEVGTTTELDVVDVVVVEVLEPDEVGMPVVEMSVKVDSE